MYLTVFSDSLRSITSIQNTTKASDVFKLIQNNFHKARE